MDYLLDGIRGLIDEPGRIVMMLIGCLLIFLAIKKGLEPALLLPMGFGAILVNIPLFYSYASYLSYRNLCLLAAYFLYTLLIPAYIF